MNFWSADNYINMLVLKFSKKSLGFPGSSADKESACNAGDPGSITGFGRPPLEESMATHSSIPA